MNTVGFVLFLCIVLSIFNLVTTRRIEPAKKTLTYYGFFYNKYSDCSWLIIGDTQAEVNQKIKNMEESAERFNNSLKDMNWKGGIKAI